MSSKFSTAETSVLWDIEGCPVPNGLCPDLISKNIKSALENMGYIGEVSITVYYDTNLNPDDFESAGIKLVRTSAIDRYARGSEISSDVFDWAPSRNPSNWMVILRDCSESDDVVETICDLKSPKENVLLGLAQPQKASRKLLGKASSVWLWTSLSAGGSPIKDQSGRSSQQRLDDNTSVYGGSSSQRATTPNQQE
ncbi:unnamed protein product [Thlaspi arvense]|uniref:NYN domain-containing protein n=1 Tax=Thlaspi arvense TaxID=13288 RepID=A0AAU9TAD9_THLAR|nr:unnamed protein product [Thlaspi arvense]